MRNLMKKQYIWIILLLTFIFLGSRYLKENLNEEKKDRVFNLDNKKTPVFDFEDGVYEYYKHFTGTAESYSASSTTGITRDSLNASIENNTKETRDNSGKNSTTSASLNLSDKSITESIDLDSKMSEDSSDRSNISNIDIDKEEVVKDEDPNSRLRVEAILRESIYKHKMKNFIKPSNESCKRRLPHCMVVGVAKSGTREIMDFMRLHPHIEIWHRDSGYEMEYFGPKEYGRGQEWFRSQMPCSYSNQITIMKNAWYFHSTSIPERIKKLNESIKLILLVREPVARAISQFTFMNNKHHRVLSFDDVAIKNNTVNEKDLSIRLSMYDRSMKTWLKYFNLDQFLIIDSNEMKYQPATVMTKVEDFLGLGHYITPEMFVLNKDKGFYCIKSNLTKSGMACYANDRGRTVTKVSQRTRTMLENHYRPINERFFSIIGKSFNWNTGRVSNSVDPDTVQYFSLVWTQAVEKGNSYPRDGLLLVNLQNALQMECGPNKCPQLVLFLLNILVFVVGAAVLAAALFLKFGSGYVETEVTSLLNNINVDLLPLGTMTEMNVYIMIGEGVVLITSSIIGMCGAWHSVNECLYVFIFVNIFLILLQIAVTVFWVILRNASDEWLKGNFIKLLVNYEGPTADDAISKGWNTLFMKMKCCGVNSQYNNGGTNNDFNELSTNWWSNRGSDNIPATCCNGVTKDTVSNFVGSATCTTSTPPKNYYETGCYEKIKTLVEFYSMFLFLVAGAIFFVQMISIVCACMITNRKNKVENKTDPSKVPKQLHLSLEENMRKSNNAYRY